MIPHWWVNITNLACIFHQHGNTDNLHCVSHFYKHGGYYTCQPSDFSATLTVLPFAHPLDRSQSRWIWHFLSWYRWYRRAVRAAYSCVASPGCLSSLTAAMLVVTLLMNFALAVLVGACQCSRVPFTSSCSKICRLAFQKALKNLPH